jgi:hypothetical protein
MNAKRMKRRWLRIAVAMTFGFMSLGHGPVMTFAHAAPHAPGTPAGHHAAAPGAHEHHAAPATGTAVPCDDQDAVTDHEPAEALLQGPMHDAAPCNAFGCFISVGAPQAAAPVPGIRLLGKLKPLPPAAVSPAYSEPADPPPRLHG